MWFVADDDQRLEKVERQFAANLKSAREDRGVSQVALAQHMADRGHRWHQSTVFKVEAGRRAVRIGEAKDLAAILDTTVDSLSATGDDRLMTAAIEARKAWQHYAESHLASLGARNAWDRKLAELAAAIKSARELPDSERPEEELHFAEDTFLMASEDPAAVREHEGADHGSH